MQIAHIIHQVRQDNHKKFEKFKSNLGIVLKEEVIANPYLWISVGVGMAAIRSLIFGGGLGICGYALVKTMRRKYKNEKV